MKTNILALTLLVFCSSLYAQTDAGRIVRDMQLDLETTTTVSGGNFTPIWLSSNRYGLSSTHKTWNYERAAIHRVIENDSTRRWKLGWGADLAVMFGGERTINVTELYAEAAYRKLYITVGSKKQPLMYRNELLTTGGLSYGINSRPIPQIRAGVDFFNVPWTKGWFQIKGYISYGWYTDGRWQVSYANNDKARRSSGVLYHEKAIYGRVGRLDKFPLQIETGLQFATQYGGTIHDYGGKESIPMTGGFKGAWNALIFGGSDFTDGANQNYQGNHQFGWITSLRFQKNGWMARAYWEMFFEDNLVFKYGIKDHFVGGEVQLPKNPFLRGFVVEHMSTYTQTGAVNHDPTATMPLELGGRKNIYNHHLYNGWQNYGMTMGNPFITSPLYNEVVYTNLLSSANCTNQPFLICNNRVEYWHFALQGEPIEGLTWRALLTFTKNWGTYYNPTKQPGIKQNSYMLEVGYRPTKWKYLQGWQGKLALGLDSGDLIGNNRGIQFTIIKTFNLNPTK